MTIPSPRAGQMPEKFTDAIRTAYNNDGLTPDVIVEALFTLDLVVFPTSQASPVQLDEVEVRRDERLRVAELLEANRETLERFLGQRSSAIDLLAFLLRLAP